MHQEGGPLAKIKSGGTTPDGVTPKHDISGEGEVR